MAKAFKKIFAISIMAVLCVLTLCAPVALADADKSQTHLYFEGEDGKAPFNKQDITVTIGDKDYNFNSSGSNSWKNGDSIGEQNLGENESISVTITDKTTGSKYDAELVNHSSANGNNKNNKNGTDNYNIVIKTPAVDTPAENNEEPIVENNEEKGPMMFVKKPVVENNEEPIVVNNEEKGPMMFAKKPIVENNEEPVVENNEEPIVENNEEKGPMMFAKKPVVENNEEPVVENNEESVVVNNEEPVEQPAQQPVKKTVASGAKQSSKKSSGSASSKNVASTASAGELVVIRDEDVPLADAPATGDISAVWTLMSFVSVGGLVLMSSKRK